MKTAKCCVAFALWTCSGSFLATAADDPTSIPLSPLEFSTRQTNLSVMMPAFYYSTRDTWLQRHEKQQFCSDIELTSAETNVDAYLSAARTKAALLTQSSSGAVGYGSGRPFYEARGIIEKSPIFPVFKSMPKGGNLHVHSTSAGRVEWLLTNAIYRTNCHVYWTADTNDSNRGTLRFLTPQQISSNPGQWSNYISIAEALVRVPDFTGQLRQLLTIGREDEGKIIWPEFDHCRTRMLPLIMDYATFEDYFIDAFETMVRDGIQYVELRTDIPYFTTPGIPNDATNGIRQYVRLRDKMRKKHPDFDLRVIVSPYRGLSLGGTSNAVLQAVMLRATPDLRDFVLGFDLVGEETYANSTWTQIPVLFSYVPQITNQYRTTLPFYFHDGESQWPGDNNLIDAILLRSVRLGHAFNLFRFPELEAVVRANKITIEICPISNQALRLVSDLRIHPAAGYLNRGLQGVLSSDDPCILGNLGLSYDFWEAYMAWNLDLRAVKKLAMNSLACSGMAEPEKQTALARWQREWNRWIESLQPLVTGSKPQPNPNP